MFLEKSLRMRRGPTLTLAEYSSGDGHAQRRSIVQIKWQVTTYRLQTMRKFIRLAPVNNRLTNSLVLSIGSGKSELVRCNWSLHFCFNETCS